MPLLIRRFLGIKVKLDTFYQIKLSQGFISYRIMPSANSSDRHKPSANPKAKSSLVHKPFATGTINIFNPHRSKKESKPSPPKLFLNAELEDLDKQEKLARSQLESDKNEIEYRDRSWVDSLFSFWGISAIAILVTINLISAGFIWRDRNTVEPNEIEPIAKIGNNDLSDKEYMPLNLSTLGTIKTTSDEEIDSAIALEPIAPALAPLDNIASISSENTPFHYILTEYTGERSLSLAQKKVPQVSLVNFPQGVLIYMGAFKNREDAQKFVAQLKQEDFSATVYPLD